MKQKKATVGGFSFKQLLFGYLAVTKVLYWITAFSEMSSWNEFGGMLVRRLLMQDIPVIVVLVAMHYLEKYLFSKTHEDDIKANIKLYTIGTVLFVAIVSGYVFLMDQLLDEFTIGNWAFFILNQLGVFLIICLFLHLKDKLKKKETAMYAAEEGRMEFFDVINARYSHKELFLPDAVPLEDLEKIARAGLAAPNGANRQIVRLVILPDRAAVEPLSAIVEHGGLATCPAAIAVLTTDFDPGDRTDFSKEDYSACLENMLLSAVALGYQALWLDYPYFNPDNQKRAKEALGAPEGYRLWVTMPIGKPDGPGTRREKMPVEERVFYGKYGVKGG